MFWPWYTFCPDSSLADTSAFVSARTYIWPCSLLGEQVPLAQPLEFPPSSLPLAAIGFWDTSPALISAPAPTIPPTTPKALFSASDPMESVLCGRNGQSQPSPRECHLDRMKQYIQGLSVGLGCSPQGSGLVSILLRGIPRPLRLCGYQHQAAASSSHFSEL